jgi:anti-sigma-K factor RskA
MTTSSDPWDELAADYWLGEISNEEADRVEQLLSSEPEFAAEMRRLRKTAMLYVETLPLETPPPHLQAKVLSAAYALNTSSQFRPTPREISPWLGIVTAAAALLVLGLGIDNYRLRVAQRDMLQTPELAVLAPNALFYSFKGTESAKLALGRMIVNPKTLEALITFENLPPLPQGKVYALWALRNGKTIPCGQFQANAQGQAVDSLLMPPVYQERPWVKEAIVTVEDAAVPDQPKGPTILKTA